MLLLIIALPLFAQEATTTATTEPATSTAPPAAPATTSQKPESDLVKAAHDAKAKKQASTKKPITNADLKKAKSKLLTHDPVPVATDATASAAVVADTRGPIAKDDEHYRDRKAAEERVKILSAKVSELEKDLDRLEQSYYNENDPNERDTVIFKRFGQTKKQLEGARKELADARDGLDSVNKRP